MNLSTRTNISSADGGFSATDCHVCREIIDPYIVPLISILGILGNVLSAVVILSTSTIRKVPSSIHLIGLSSADSVFLLVLNLLTKGGCHHQGICQICIFAQYASTFWSVWLLVSFTAERFIAVVFPMQQLRLANWTITRRIIGAVILVGCIISSPWLYIAVFDSQEKYCSARRTPIAGVLFSVMGYLETVCTFFLPLVIICIFNFMIARTVAKSNKQPGGGATLPNSNNNMNTSNAEHQRQRRERTTAGITRTLLIVSLFFVLCNLPTYIIQTILKIKVRFGEDVSPRLLLARQLCEYLYYLNFTLNFVLYTFTSSGFRESLSQLVRRVVLCRGSALRGVGRTRGGGLLTENSVKVHLNNIDIPNVYSRRMLEARKSTKHFRELSQYDSSM